MKVAVVCDKKEAAWVSCRTINQSIHAAYANASVMSRTFELDYNLVSYSLLAFVDQIKIYNPTHISIIETKIQKLIPFLTALSFVYKNQKQPQLIFHVYGDFSLEPWSWLKASEVLYGQQIYLVCASQRQAGFVKSFLTPASQDSVQVLPFGYIKEKFFFSEEIRNSERRNRGWTEDKILFYSGRISSQKNLLPSIKWILDSLSKNEKFKIVIAGSFDDIHAPFFKNENTSKAYSADVLEYLDSLPELVRSKIELLGSLNATELNRVNNAADLFFSLSTYHDEDYGMSPAEALATGLSSVLSSWGGYADFIEKCKNAYGVKTVIDEKGLSIDRSGFCEAINKILISPVSSILREKYAQDFAKQYETSALAMRLTNLISVQAPLFYGFNRKMHFHQERMSKFWNGQAPYVEPSRLDRYYFCNYGYYTGELV